MKNPTESKIFQLTGLSFWCDWLQIKSLKQFNWLSFTFVHMYIEKDNIFNEFVFEAGLLGFNIRWQLGLDWLNGGTEQKEEVLKRAKEIETMFKVGE